MSPQDFLIQTHLNLLENIKLADQKATAFIAIDSAAIAALFGAQFLILNPANIWGTILSVTTFVILGIGVLLGGFVIWPRGEKMADHSTGGNLALPSKIARLHDAPAPYTAAVVAACAGPAIVEQLGALVFVRSQINNKKYFWLKAAILVSACGLLCAAVFVVVNSL